jgi:hypothetical protein
MEEFNMRIGTLLFGGLIGAGAVIYWNRRGKQAAMSAVSTQTGNMMNRMMNRGSKMDRHADKAASKVTSHTQNDSMFGLNKVEEIVNKDPELKRHVDEIIHSQHSSSHKEAPVITQ